MSNATLQVGGGNWAAKDGKLLGYAVEPTSGRYLAREFTVNRNSSKWVLGSDGYLYEVPADQPALEYYSDGTFRGALVEPESTNLVLRSEEFNNNYWLKNEVTLSANVAISPNGQMNAYKLKATAVNNYHALRGVVGYSSLYTGSCYLKKGEYRYAYVGIERSSNSTVQSAIIDLETGLITNSYSTTGTPLFNVVDVGNGWYRLNVTQIQNSTGTSNVLTIGISDNGTYNSIILQRPRFTGDGTSGIYIWGAQLEQSPIATSYIPTTTGAVTRLKDDISFTNASSVIGQSEGTLFVEVDWQKTSGLSQIILSINDDSVDNRLELFGLSGSDEIRLGIGSNGFTQTPLDVSSSGLTGIVKLAAAYADGDSEIYINGSSIGSGTPDLSSLATLTNVDFGQNWNSGGQANMWIRAVALFTTRLSDPECEALTTL